MTINTDSQPCACQSVTNACACGPECACDVTCNCPPQATCAAA